MDRGSYAEECPANQCAGGTSEEDRKGAEAPHFHKRQPPGSKQEASKGHRSSQGHTYGCQCDILIANRLKSREGSSTRHQEADNQARRGKRESHLKAHGIASGHRSRDLRARCCRT